MYRLTVKQQEMLHRLERQKDEALLYNRGIELFVGCGLWKTAWALERKDLVEIYRNENDQLMVYLKGEI